MAVQSGQASGFCLLCKSLWTGFIRIATALNFISVQEDFATIWQILAAFHRITYLS